MRSTFRNTSENLKLEARLESMKFLEWYRMPRISSQSNSIFMKSQFIICQFVLKMFIYVFSWFFQARFQKWFQLTSCFLASTMGADCVIVVVYRNLYLDSYCPSFISKQKLQLGQPVSLKVDKIMILYLKRKTVLRKLS